MNNGSTQSESIIPHKSRSQLSFGWIFLFVLFAWVAVMIAPQPNSDPEQIEPPVKIESSSKSGLEVIAARRGDHRSLEQILNGNELIDAVVAKDEDRVRKSLAAGADVNSRYVDICLYGYTALMEASILGDEHLVQLLLERRADVNLERDGLAAIHHAVRLGHQKVVQQLVAAGARHDPDKLRLTNELFRASCKGFSMQQGEGFPLFPGCFENPETALSIVEVLKKGADVNSTDQHGFTPLMYAANLGLLDNVKTLLANGADLKHAAKDGSTAITLASRPDSSVNQTGRVKVVRYLQDVLMKDNNDRTRK